MADEHTGTALELAAELTIAWLSNPNTKAAPEDVVAYLQQMHAAMTGLTAGRVEPAAEPSAQFEPAVSVRKSLASRDHLISLIDGKPYKSLRRHLSRHGLTPEQYRERYGLKPDYPMVSEAYSEVRREMAKKIGLGRRLGQPPRAKQQPGSRSRSQPK